MPTLPLPFSEIQRSVEAYHTALDEGWGPPDGTRGGRSAVGHAMSILGMALNRGHDMTKRLDTAVALGIHVRSWRTVDPTFVDHQLRRYRAYDTEFQDAESTLTRPGAPRPGRSGRGTASPKLTSGQLPGRGPDPAPPAPSDDGLDVLTLASKIVPLLRKGPMSIQEIAAALKVGDMVAYKAVAAAHDAGASILERKGRWLLMSEPALGLHRSDELHFTTKPDGTFTFAVATDMHLCSKYERLDCLGDFYDEVERREIPVVLNAGNWIDGEASFNMHDLLVHGMDAQMQYLAAHYPKRKDVTTYAITGADHEGWYARREGVDVGKYAQNVMRQADRKDWIDLGYMERYVPLRHYSSGESSPIHVMHPGGGSAYAISYTTQKIVESYDGGEKPSVLVTGHYHKSGYNLIRNVHAMQGGCFQDQTVFMRQRRLSAHVGGCFVTVKVDPRTGAVVECSYTFRNYFVREYYSGRWSQHGAVNLAPRMERT